MRSKQTFFLSIISVLLIGWATSCTDVDITMPKGPKGDTGLSAYEFWKEKVADGTIDWPKNEVEVTDFFKYLKGKDGKDGKSAYEVWKEEIATGNVDDPHNPGQKWDPAKSTVSDFWKFLTGATGENGQTPHIGENGNWWIGDVDTNVPARGKDGKPGEPGKDAEPPVVTIGANGNWFVDGVDTGKPSKGADGKDGKTPTITIGDNGNWFVDGEDTGKPALGKDGKSPEVIIGENGNWWINGKDTGKPAYGKKGDNGKSAYELWKEEVAAGYAGTGPKVKDPKNPTEDWPQDKVSQADFWEFLRGADGKSAYEIWKEKVLDGTIDWPKDEVEVTDFFKFLKGKDGKDGIDGKSAYEVWKEEIATGNVDDPHNPGNKWDPNKNTISDFWKFLTGATGENGQTPHIGENGNWWIGDVDTNVPARGKDGKPGEPGKDAEPPVVTIGANGNWFIDGVDTGKPSKGADGNDGATPTIGTNGNWFINGEDTGKPAIGKDGKAPEVIIGNNNNWWINGVDTGKPAYGKDGKDGKDGKSAYELWKEEVDAGCAGTGPKVKHPHKPTEDWPCSMTSQTNFWQYLSGKDGTSTVIEIVKGKFNVIPQYYNADLNEYVTPVDGSVKFQIYDKEGNKAPENSIVRGLPGVTDPNHEFKTNADGIIIVPRNLLPDNLKDPERRGVTAAVTINGVTEESANNTYVPNRINTRIRMTEATLEGDRGRAIGANSSWTNANFIYERQVDGAWSQYPNTLPKPLLQVIQVKDPQKEFNGANIDDSQEIHKTWFRSDQGSYIMIFRPHVLLPDEQTYYASNPNHELRKREWKGTDMYFALRGKENFYGETPITDAAVLSPEIQPYPGLQNNIKVHVEHGITYIWGEVDFDGLKTFYEREFTQTAGGKLWRTERKQVSALAPDFILRVASVSNVGGSIIDSYVRVAKNKKRFQLTGAYPNNSNIYVYEASGAWYYRSMHYYKFTKEGEKYYLVNRLNPSDKMEVKYEKMPSDYLN
ncbi:collagen-like domain-containing protein [Bacteroides pyogenes]|uniref:hypothetical protein n=1 Tax=Bacteroides pyogenes TaxID=310300 RepID=UPI000E175F3D|nr:hypothetical protein [Bacteroides pyogenes]MBB3894892.1 hypothetical protein [Bacteroides pyogenes]SUV33152.1 putative lipoprotein [Bacteroides pyogenes]